MLAWFNKLAHRIAPPSGSTAIKRQGDEHLKHDELDNAARCYRQAISFDPDYVDARIGLGFTLIGQRQYAEAKGHLQHALSIDPDIADAHYLLGTAAKAQGELESSIAHFTQALRCKTDFEFAYRDLFVVLCQTGELDRAKDLLNNAVDVFPKSAEFQFYLGNLLSDEGSFAEAITHYGAAVALRPDAVEMHNMMGNALWKSGNLERALTSFRTAITLKPDSVDGYMNIGTILQQQGKNQDAITSYKQAVGLGPQYSLAHHHLGNAYLKIGATEWAIACFRKAVELDPDNGVQHLVDALSGSNSEHAPSKYVENLFDGYADSFDSHLVQRLQYGVPEQLVGLLKPYANQGGPQWDVLDLGCGTGLVGLAIAPLALQLVGVDLSAKMLARAKARNLYSRLERLELVTMADAEPDASYDLVTAADVFIYVGRLEALVSQVRRLLRPNGLFAFSIECLDPSTQQPAGTDSDCQLTSTGRYVHSAAYVRRLAAANDFECVSFVDTCVRLEKGQPVPGQIAVLRRRGIADVASSPPELAGQ
jgi:predicted TPR repeat methyltransferase